MGIRFNPPVIINCLTTTMKSISTISIIAMATIVSSCYPFAMDYFGAVCLICENNSDSDLWFSYDDSPNRIDDPVYEIQRYSYEYISGDIQSAVFYGYRCFYQVKKKASNIIFQMPTKNGWKWVKKYCYPDSLRIQVWDDALIQKVGWEEFVKNYGNYKYELEYVIDLGGFNNNLEDATIAYPPSGSEDYIRIVYPQTTE